MDESAMQYQCAQRDALDIATSGKLTPEEARTLDPRMDELQDFSTAVTPEQIAANVQKPVSPQDTTDVRPLDEAPGISPERDKTDPISKQEAEKGLPDVKSNFGFRSVPR